MIISKEELAWALETHVDFAEAILDRIRSRQHRDPSPPKPLPIVELVKKMNRHAEQRGLTLPSSRGLHAIDGGKSKKGVR